jgi:hypothetical protein
MGPGLTRGEEAAVIWLGGRLNPAGLYHPTTVGAWLPADDHQLEAFDAVVTRFFDRVGDLLPPHRRNLYRRLVDRGPDREMRITGIAFCPRIAVTTFDFSTGTAGASMSAPTISLI